MGKRPLPLLVRLRGAIQAAAALLTNIHLPNFLSGRLYQGNGKRVCVPGLNSRHRVIGASFGEGMAAADAPQRKPASLQSAVLLDRLEGVLRASRRIAAAGRLERRDISPVKPHERQKQPLHG